MCEHFGQLIGQRSVRCSVSMLVMPSSVPVLAILRYALCRAGEDHPDVQGRLGWTRLEMVLQPPSAKNGTFLAN